MAGLADVADERETGRMSAAGRDWVRYGVPLGLIVAVGAALRIAQLDQSLVADELWDLSAELDSISDLDTFHLTQGRGDEVRTDPGDRRTMKIAEANATRYRSSRSVPTQPPTPQGYDRSRIVLDRPKIRIHSRDFH